MRYQEDYLTGYNRRKKFRESLAEEAEERITLRFTNALKDKYIEQLEEEKAELKNQARKDYLTGLLNKKSIKNEIREEIDRANDSGYSLSLLMLDLDNFKEVNDTLGHQEGDRYIEGVANTLDSVTRDGEEGRKSDTTIRIGRYGGDEFLALLPGADETDVEKVKMRIRDTVERYIENHFEGTNIGGNQGISIGGATYNPAEHPNPLDEEGIYEQEIKNLLEEADEEMYEDKG